VSGAVRVAFVHPLDARDVRSWSGTLFFSKCALECHVGPVVDLTPAPFDLRPYRVARRAVRALTGREYNYEHEPHLARRYARYFSRAIAETRPDLIFAPAASTCVAGLEAEVPIVYYSDATWRAVQGYHAQYSRALERSARSADDLERRTLERAALALFSSEWAARSAIDAYGADPARVHVVHIGANLLAPPRRDAVLPRTLGPRLRLLLVGVDWEGKGADVAVEALQALRQLGHDAELTVIGCAPEARRDTPGLTMIPFLNKQVPAQRARFEALWREADFFVLPTRFEAAGVVFCEASAYAVPSLATRTGGVASLVAEGRNGYTLPPDASGADYARCIAALAEDPARYARLCETSRAEYEQRLNWDRWGERVAALIADRLPHLAGRLPQRSDAAAAPPPPA
jgi:glycosyltransferase involved in cell wall biosynthesis